MSNERGDPSPPVRLPKRPPRRSMLTPAVRAACEAYATGMAWDTVLHMSGLRNGARFEMALAEHRREQEAA